MLPNKSIIYPIKTISSIGISVAGPNLAVQSIYKYLHVWILNIYSGQCPSIECRY